MKQQPTFVFEGEKVYAVAGKKVIASADNVGDLERKVAEQWGGQFDTQPGGNQMGGEVDPAAAPDIPPVEGLEHGHPGETQQPCVECGHLQTPGDKFCPGCGTPVDPYGVNPDDPGVAGQGMENPYPHDEHQGLEDPMDPRLGKEIVTPNGLRGTVLGKTKDLWGDTVTVRFSNGRIVQLPVTDDLKIEAAGEKSQDLTDIDKLEKNLTASVDGTRESLSARSAELTQIKRGATDLLRQGAAHVDLDRLNNIVVQADYELQEVGDAIEYLDQAEPFTPAAPFEPRAVEQESIGHGDSTWLDDTINEMASEAENTDYDKLMDEGPEAFVGEIDTPVLEQPEAVMSMASSYIRSKTAGANEEVRVEYEKIWLDRIAAVSKTALTEREQEVQQRKEAAVQEEEPEGPDEGLFT